MTATDTPEPAAGATASTAAGGQPQRGDQRIHRPRPAGAPRSRPPRREVPDPVIDCGIYVDGVRQPAVEPRDALRIAIERGGFVWLGLYEPTEAELGVYAEEYGLHPL